jgi:predicted RNase H-like nuclease (RuvC/YqgF family)
VELLKLEEEKAKFEQLSSTEVPENVEDRIVEQGGTVEELSEKTQEVDAKIEAKKEETEEKAEKINQLKGWQEQKNQLDKFKEWQNLKEQMKELASTITNEEWEKINEYYADQDFNARISSERMFPNTVTAEGGGSILSREDSFSRSRAERDLMLQKLKEGELYYSDIVNTDPVVALFLIKKLRGEFSPDAFITEDPFYIKKNNLG